jgi:mannose-1-phosphate guanylyltransferase
MISFSPPWALILAGGDGARLRALTTQISGDPRPKQFCPIVDGETLLDRTRRRVDLLTRADQQVVVVSRTHEPYYGDLAQELAPDRLVVQPSNAGTGPGVLYPLLRIQRLAGNVTVAVFPSDHYISEDAAFMEYVRTAHELVEGRPQAVVLLGIEAQTPETEYGWIERAPWPLDGEAGYPVLRFWE